MKKRVWWLCVLLVFFWALLGWGQYSSDYGTTVRLQFSGHLTTAGSCQKLSNTHIRCQVPAGTQGRLQLQATVTPSTKQVSIVAVSLPSWASFMLASGYGTVSSSCAFTPPARVAGTTVQLVFRASVPGTSLAGNLTVTLDVTGGAPPPPPSYGPYSGVTDGSGRFSILIPWLGDTYIAGTLTECTQRILAYTSLSVTLVPKWIGGSIGSMQDIGSVRVSSSGYNDVTVSDLRFTSSMDLWGRTTGTAQLSDVCLLPTDLQGPGYSMQPINGITDVNGEFTLTLPWRGATVTGRLTECTVRPLPDQAFSVTLLPKGDAIGSAEDIGGFTFFVSGYSEETVPIVSRFSIFNLISISVGDVCFERLIEEGYLDPGIGEIGEEKCPCAVGKSCEFTVPEGVKEALSKIQDDIRQVEKALAEQALIVEGVELALAPTKTTKGPVVYDEDTWPLDKMRSDLKSEGRTEDEIAKILDAFVKCHWLDVDKQTYNLKKASVKRLSASVVKHLKAKRDALGKSLAGWQQYVSNEKDNYKAHCGKPHSPCECFKLEVFVGKPMPANAPKTPHALAEGQPVSKEFLEKIAEGTPEIPAEVNGDGGQPKIKLAVPNGEWLAVRAVGKKGLHKYKLDGKTTDCCWLEREFGAFVQVLVVWPEFDREDLLKRNAPPHKAPSGDFIRDQWLSGVVELGAYQTYSWTPSGYLVQLHNLAAQAQLGGMTLSGLKASGVAGAVLKERREDWVLWIPPSDAKTGTATLLLLVNGTVCQELKVSVGSK